MRLNLADVASRVLPPGPIHRASRTSAQPEHTPGEEPARAGKAKEAHTRGSSPQYIVVVTSFRRRLLDEDNLCVKWHVDGLRYAGVLPDDRPGLTSIRVSQVKVKTKQEERTEIEIWIDSEVG